MLHATAAIVTDIALLVGAATAGGVLGSVIVVGASRAASLLARRDEAHMARWAARRLFAPNTFRQGALPTDPSVRQRIGALLAQQDYARFVSLRAVMADLRSLLGQSRPPQAPPACGEDPQGSGQ